MHWYELAEQSGLDLRTLKQHAERVKSALTGSEPSSAYIPIEDTCRLDNGGIIPLPAANSLNLNGQYIAFIPAAGVASRYGAPVAELLASLEALDENRLAKARESLRSTNAETWPLPEIVRSLILGDYHSLDATLASTVSTALRHPKALLPCVGDAEFSFLQMKRREHAALGHLGGEVYVVPEGRISEFADEAAKTQGAAPLFLEQGKSLSTIRFEPTGQPVIEDGTLSPVPAGHGCLATLLPQVRQKFPNAHSIFTRTIDNLNGTSPRVIDATNRFLTFHSTVLAAVKKVRSALAKNDLNAAALAAGSIFDIVGYRRAKQQSPEAVLRELSEKIFHTGVSSAGSLEEFGRIFSRPVNILGQVPNLHKDVGGTPCFVTLRGQKIKLCLEVPHASPDDKQAFLANPRLATHFNPVFVAAEFVASSSFYADASHDLWLLAKKTYRGRPVVYHESALYELLGNSAIANCIFCEIPRFLFNPNKSLADAAGAKLADWLNAAP